MFKWKIMASTEKLKSTENMKSSALSRLRCPVCTEFLSSPKTENEKTKWLECKPKVVKCPNCTASFSQVIGIMCYNF